MRRCKHARFAQKQAWNLPFAVILGTTALRAREIRVVAHLHHSILLASLKLRATPALLLREGC